MEYPREFLCHVMWTFPKRIRLHRMVSTGQPVDVVFKKLFEIHNHYIRLAAVLSELYPEFQANELAWSQVEGRLEFYRVFYKSMEKERACRHTILLLLEIFDKEGEGQNSKIEETPHSPRIQ